MYVLSDPALYLRGVGLQYSRACVMHVAGLLLVPRQPGCPCPRRPGKSSIKNVGKSLAPLEVRDAEIGRTLLGPKPQRVSRPAGWVARAGPKQVTQSLAGLAGNRHGEKAPFLGTTCLSGVAFVTTAGRVATEVTQWCQRDAHAATNVTTAMLGPMIRVSAMLKRGQWLKGTRLKGTRLKGTGLKGTGSKGGPSRSPRAVAPQ